MKVLVACEESQRVCIAFRECGHEAYSCDILPVKVEQTVHYIFDGFIEPCTVEVIFLSDYEDKDGNCTYMADIHFDRDDCPYTVAEIYFTDIGKTIFLTKEEAEKALKGGIAK